MKLPKVQGNIIFHAGLHKAVLLFFAILISLCAYCQMMPHATKGVLDLRKWNWQKDGITDLNGEWEFYWKKFYTPTSFDTSVISPSVYNNVPNFWNKSIKGIGLFEPAFGFATYRLKVLCPQDDEKLALKFLTIASAYKLFINGNQIAEVGKAGTTEANTSAEFKPMLILVKPENNELNIIIQVANYSYGSGGLWDFIKLGPQEKVHQYWIRNVSLDFFVAGSFFLMGFFYFIIYLFFRRRKASLYFSIFCLLLSIRPLITDELAIRYIANADWQMIKHLEYISLYLSVPVMCLFSYELFPKEFSGKVLKYVLIISSPFVLITIFASPFIFRYTLRPFEIFMLFTAVYGFMAFIKAYRNKRPGSGYFLIGFVILFATFINDLLYTSLVIESIHLVYVGLFIMIISQAITLSNQFFWTFSRLEIVNKKLEESNEELYKKNITINEVNDQLTKLNSDLDVLVFRTSHDLRSPITSIVALTFIIKEEKNEEKRNVYLDLQRKTLDRLNSLITDILEFSKNKRTDLSIEEVKLNELINDALQDHIFSDNSWNIKRVVEVSQHDIFKSDKTRITMVLANLISNALKYHNKEKPDAFLKIVAKVTPIQAILIVEDNGQGIEERHVPHIFSMFYRASKISSGSGLGLYIVKEAIEKLGGQIKVESRLNEGTKFTIFIPNCESV